MVKSSDRVTDSGIASQSFANLYNLINDRTNVPDPMDISGERKFVYNRFPFIHSNNFAGYPFVVITRSGPHMIGDTADLTKSNFSFNFKIIVYAVDKKYNASDSSGNPSGAVICEEIVDHIIETFETTLHKKEFMHAYAMGDQVYTLTNSEEEDLDGNFVYTTTFDVNYKNAYIK